MSNQSTGSKANGSNGKNSSSNTGGGASSKNAGASTSSSGSAANTSGAASNSIATSATTNTGAAVTAPVSKKDKRKQQIATKLNKLEEQFQNEKDFYYRESLVKLQYKLSTLHSGENQIFLQKCKDFEELRDSELVRLRLAEEYLVKFVTDEFKKEYETAVNEREELINLVKLKLNEKLFKKIKQLKQDKVLMDMATVNQSGHHHTSGSTLRYNLTNSHSSQYNSQYNDPYNSAGGNGGNGSGAGESNNNGGNNSNVESSSSLLFPGERRSRRTHANRRYDSHSLNIANSSNAYSNNNADDSYDSATGGTGTGYGSAGNTTAGNTTRDAGGAGGYTSTRGRRARNARGGAGSGHDSSNNERDGNGNSASGENSSGSNKRATITDSEELNLFLYGHDYKRRFTDKTFTRHTGKSYTDLQGIKSEELNEDLTLIRNAAENVNNYKKTANDK
ncbi:hypothetical protein B5S28_g4615 [[Candida] boidinii]|nr:hypothetical protein B5S28_g4615 [[Candida] boidinii]OWB63963.1 hypothetical protein B5S29_g4985 [[Candida] boidinii]OWB74987.1 hypothetical protein B5S31_g4830 [[Candida] boidinii]